MVLYNIYTQVTSTGAVADPVPQLNPSYGVTQVTSTGTVADSMPQLNPSYGVTQVTSTGAVVDPVPQLNPSYGVTQFTYTGAVACCNSQDTTGVKVTAKKPARGCPCSWVSIGFVLVGVVACVSMVVAVWSIAEVHTISYSCETWKEDSEIVGQANTDRIDELNATLISVINPEVPAGLLPSVPLLHVCKSLQEVLF